MKTTIYFKPGAMRDTVMHYEDLMPSFDLSPDNHVIDLIDADCGVHDSIPLPLVERVVWENE